jgi:hypothetical protein
MAQDDPIRLTRRRADNQHQETWNVYYGDVLVGSIYERAGVPNDVEPWGWTCGFHPGMGPGQHTYGVADDFKSARAGFEADWNRLLPTLKPEAFAEWRSFRDHKAEILAKRQRGEKLDTEFPSSMMRCVCGARFDSHNPEESLPHRVHIYESQK